MLMAVAFSRRSKITFSSQTFLIRQFFDDSVVFLIQKVVSRLFRRHLVGGGRGRGRGATTTTTTTTTTTK
jgi:hypothetical protein